MPALWEVAAALHLPVFPLRGDKTPACAHGHKDAETDPARIEALFKKCGGELIGVPTGEVSGFAVLDADITRHTEARDWLDAHPLPSTYRHETRSGGFHFFFQHQPGLRGWTKRPVIGIDGRGDGGYIVWWRAAGLPVRAGAVLPWPSWLLKACAPPPPPKRYDGPLPSFNSATLAGVMGKLLRAQNGERNSLLFWTACRAGEWISVGEIRRGEIEALLTDAAARIGLGELESARTIHSGIARTLT